MYFKALNYSPILNKSFVVIMFAASLLGCNLQIGEEPPENPEIVIGGDPRFACMGRIGEIVQGYVEGNVLPNQTAEFFTCLQHSLRSFTQYMKPITPNQYRPENLREFLHKFFFQDRVISDDLLWRAMDLKVAVVGGEKNVITTQEINQTIELLKTLSRVLVRLQPLIRTLNLSVSEQLKPEQRASLDFVESELLWAVDQISGLIANAEGVYDLESLTGLVNETLSFVRLDSGDSSVRGARIWLALLRPLKSLTQPDSGFLLKPTDWRGFLRTKALWYMQVVRYRLSIAPAFKENASFGGLSWTKALQGSELQQLDRFARKTMMLIEEAVWAHPEKTISVDQLKPLFDVLAGFDIMPLSISSKAAESMTRTLLRQFFGDLELMPQDRRTELLNANSLAKIKKEYEDWFLVQTYVAETSGLREGFSSRDAELEAFTVPDVRRAFREVAPQIGQLFTSDRPLFFPGQDTVWMVEDPIWQASGIRRSFESLTLKNLLRVVTQGLIKGFSHDWALNQTNTSGVSADEFQSAYEAVSDLGYELNLMDPRSRRPGHRSFTEAKLFTYLADGMGTSDAEGLRSKDLLLPSQILEFFVFLYSGGVTNLRVHAELTQICGRDQPMGPVGVYGDLKLPRSCVREHYFDAFFKLVHSLPGLQHYIQNISRDRVLELTDEILSSAVPEDLGDELLSTPRWVEKSDVVVMVMITFYTEAVMTRYNLNADAILDQNEQALAYETFEGFLTKMMAEMGLSASPNAVRFVFEYILRNRKIPTPAQWWELQFWLTSWDYVKFEFGQLFDFLPENDLSLGVFNTSILQLLKKLDPNPDLKLDRGDMIAIFSSVIKEVVKGGAITPPEPPPPEPQSAL